MYITDTTAKISLNLLPPDSVRTDHHFLYATYCHWYFTAFVYIDSGITFIHLVFYLIGNLLHSNARNAPYLHRNKNPSWIFCHQTTSGQFSPLLLRQILSLVFYTVCKNRFWYHFYFFWYLISLIIYSVRTHKMCPTYNTTRILFKSSVCNHRPESSHHSL